MIDIKKECDYSTRIDTPTLKKHSITSIFINYEGFDVIADKRRNHYTLSFNNTNEKFSCFADITIEEVFKKIIDMISKRKENQKTRLKTDTRQSQIAWFAEKSKKEKQLKKENKKNEL